MIHTMRKRIASLICAAAALLLLLTGCRGTLPFAARRALFAEILADPDARAALRQRLRQDPNRLLAVPYRIGVTCRWPCWLAAYTLAKQRFL